MMQIVTKILSPVDSHKISSKFVNDMSTYDADTQTERHRGT